jgi:prepilin-type N-terminal cleavage/methylation domain-containing protein
MNVPEMAGRPHKNTRPGSDGFTLIEVLVALSLLGVGMFVLLNAHWNASMAFIETREAAELKLLTDQAIAAAEMRAYTGEKRGDGDFGDEYEGYSYRFETDEVNHDELPGLMKVSVTVERPEKEPYNLEFLIFDGTQEITSQ